MNFESVRRNAGDVGAEEGGPVKNLDLSLLDRKDYAKTLQRCGMHVQKLTVDFSDDEVTTSALINNHCRNLQQIIIKWNEKVEYPRVKHLYFFDNMDEVFDNNRALKSVEMRGYHEELMGHFVDYLRLDTRKLRIVICKSPHQTDNQFTPFTADISRLKALEMLEINGNVSLQRNTLRGFEKLQNLRILNLELDLISERFMNIISSLQNLKSLHLKYNKCYFNVKQRLSVVSK